MCRALKTGSRTPGFANCEIWNGISWSDGTTGGSCPENIRRRAVLHSWEPMAEIILQKKYPAEYIKYINLRSDKPGGFTRTRWFKAGVPFTEIEKAVDLAKQKVGGIFEPIPEIDYDSIFGIKVNLPSRSTLSEEDDEDRSEAAAYTSSLRARDFGDKQLVERKIPTKVKIAIVEQLQNGVCLTCDNPFGIYVAKGNDTFKLTMHFEHRFSQELVRRIYPGDINKLNENTFRPDNRVLCQICNGAKSDRMKSLEPPIAYTYEECKEWTDAAWTQVRVLSRQEAYDRLNTDLDRKREKLNREFSDLTNLK